jgi:hypothetical protein
MKAASAAIQQTTAGWCWLSMWVQLFQPACKRGRNRHVTFAVASHPKDPAHCGMERKLIPATARLIWRQAAVERQQQGMRLADYNSLTLMQVCYMLDGDCTKQEPGMQINTTKI